MKTIAFWKYDLFPYLLHSPVIREGSDGRVVVEGYGGMQVTPVHLLPGTHGTQVARNLDSLRAEYDTKATELLVEYKKKAAALFKKEGV